MMAYVAVGKVSRIQDIGRTWGEGSDWPHVAAVLPSTKYPGTH